MLQLYDKPFVSIGGNAIHTGQARYDMDISDRPNTNETNKRLAYLINKPDPLIPDVYGGNQPKSENLAYHAGIARALNTKKILSNSLIDNVPLHKTAFSNLVTGMIVGGATGMATGNLLGRLASVNILNKYTPFLPPEVRKGLATTVSPMVGKSIGKEGLVLGGLSGMVTAGALDMLKNINSQQYVDYPQVKYATDSPQHFFISQTGITLMPPNLLPKDIKGAVDLEHPYLKYLPLLGSGISGSIVALPDLLKGKFPFLKFTAGAAGGSMVANAVHDVIENHYAKKYLEQFAKQIDKKYKTASDDSSTEYISETGVDIFPESIGPKDIEAVILYRHKLLRTFPLLGMSVGGLIGRNTPEKIVGGSIGTAIGSLAKLSLMEHYMNPYRDKYIKSIKKKYKVSE